MVMVHKSWNWKSGNLIIVTNDVEIDYEPTVMKQECIASIKNQTNV